MAISPRCLFRGRTLLDPPSCDNITVVDCMDYRLECYYSEVASYSENIRVICLGREQILGSLR